MKISTAQDVEGTSPVMTHALVDDDPVAQPSGTVASDAAARQSAAPAEPTQAPLRTEPEKLGRWLRQERELCQLSLEELAQTTRIPLKMLQHLEEDRHDQLPGEVFARGFLRSYAKAVGVAEGEALARWEQTRRPTRVAAAPLAAATITPPERSRRFGIAIALVVLLILFTVALSIVLRPRHRDAPVELSAVTATLEARA